MDEGHVWPVTLMKTSNDYRRKDTEKLQDKPFCIDKVLNRNCIFTPRLDHYQFKEEKSVSKGIVHKVCSKIVLKCFFRYALVGLTFLLYVNKLARAVTKWTKVCDKRCCSFHHTNDYKQYCDVGN